MKLRLAALVLLPVLAVGLAAPSASAADQQRHPGVPYTVTFAAGAACDFPVTLSGIDDTTLTPRPDGSVYTHGYFDATVTNLVTGKHVFRVASGPGVFGPLGKVLYATGRWVLQVAPRHGHKARLILVTGKFKIALGSGEPYGASPGTTIVNLCELVGKG